MFYFLSKLLPLFIYPLGLACLLLGLTFFVQRWRKTQRIIIISTFMLLWLGGNRLVTMTLARSLEYQYPPLRLSAETPRIADAIVVLGGAIRPASYPRPILEFNEAGDRLLYAAYLYKQQAAPAILVSGGGALWLGPEQVDEARLMTEALKIMSVPPEAIMLERTSLNTYENALASYEVLHKQGINNVILITSAMHMPRSSRIFKQTGLNVIPAPTDFWFTNADWDYATQADLSVQAFNLIPTAQNLMITSMVLKEYIGMGIYRLRGWL